MMVACALARKKAMIHMKDTDIAARLGEGTWEGGEEADRDEEGVGQEVGMRSMVNEANILRTTFPGAAWDAGMGIGRDNSKYNVYPTMSKKDWGGGKAPYSMAEPVLWYWSRLEKVDPTQQGQSGGTTWMELTIDFQITTGIRIVEYTSSTLTIKQEANIFALASVKSLRCMGVWNKSCKNAQGITTLVPLGAPRAA